MRIFHTHEWGQIDDEYIYQCGQEIQSRECLTCGFRQYRDISEDAVDNSWYEYPLGCNSYKGKHPPLTCKEVLINFSRKIIESSIDYSWVEHESEDFHKGVEFMERRIQLLCEKLTAEDLDIEGIKKAKEERMIFFQEPGTVGYEGFIPHAKIVCEKCGSIIRAIKYESSSKPHESTEYYYFCDGCLVERYVVWSNTNTTNYEESCQIAEEEMQQRFFNQIHGCRHAHMDPDYFMGFKCSTPCCSGQEEHCLDCGAYISTCGCGCENGISDKPYWKKIKGEEDGKQYCDG